MRQVVRWDRLSTLFTDPTQLMRDVYGWGTPNFRGNLLVGNIGRVVEYISADAAMQGDAARGRGAARRAGPVPEADLDPAAQLFVSLDKGLGATAFDAGFTLYPVRPSAPGGDRWRHRPVALRLRHDRDELPAVRQPVAGVCQDPRRWRAASALLLRAGKDPEFLTDLLDGATGTPGAPAGALTMALRTAARPVGGRRSSRRPASSSTRRQSPPESASPPI